MYCTACRQERGGSARWCVVCGGELVERGREELEAERAHVRYLLSQIDGWEVPSHARAWIHARYERLERILTEALGETVARPPEPRPDGVRVLVTPEPIQAAQPQRAALPDAASASTREPVAATAAATASAVAGGVSATASAGAAADPDTSLGSGIVMPPKGAADAQAPAIARSDAAMTSDAGAELGRGHVGMPGPQVLAAATASAPAFARISSDGRDGSSGGPQASASPAMAAQPDSATPTSPSGAAMDPNQPIIEALPVGPPRPPRPAPKKADPARPVFEVPPPRTPARRAVNTVSTWNAVGKPFLYEGIFWFLGAVLILAGTFYFVAESWAGLGSVSRALLVFSVAAAYSAAFGIGGAVMSRKPRLLPAGRALGAIGAAVAPIAAIALTPMARAVPVLLVVLAIAWAFGAAVLARRPARAWAEPFAPSLQLIAGLSTLAIDSHCSARFPCPCAPRSAATAEKSSPSQAVCASGEPLTHRAKACCSGSSPGRRGTAAIATSAAR